MIYVSLILYRGTLERRLEFPGIDISKNFHLALDEKNRSVVFCVSSYLGDALSSSFYVQLATSDLCCKIQLVCFLLDFVILTIIGFFFSGSVSYIV